MAEEPFPVSPLVPAGLKKAGIVVACCAVAAVAFGIYNRERQGDAARQWANESRVRTVRLVTVERRAKGGDLTLPGEMRAWNAAKLYARVGGYLKQWYGDIGASVKAGAPLASIDTPELDQQIAQARASLASAGAAERLAHSTAARWNDLLATNSVSRQEVDEKDGAWAVQRAAVAGARADLGRLQAMKAFATVRAPFSGVVTMRQADIGDLVGPGASAQQPLFVVSDVRRVRVYVGVPQAASTAIHVGQAASLSVPDYPGRSFPAQVLASSGAIDPQSGTLQVQLVADNPGRVLKPGGYAQVSFDLPDAADGVVLPSTALMFRAAGTQVATVDRGGHVRLHPVVIARDLGSIVEIASGVSAGQRIVDNPGDSLGEGQKVRVGGG